MENMQKAARIILMVVLLIMAGCGRSETPQEKFQKKVAYKLLLMQKRFEDLKYAYNDKLVEMHQKFDEQMAAAQKEHNEAMAAVQKKYNEAMSDLRHKREAAKKEMAGLKSATGENWGKAKEKMDKTMTGLEKALEKEESEFK